MQKYQDIELIQSVSNRLMINIQGEAIMTASLSANKTVQSIKISVYLQRYEDSTWVPIEHWSQEYLEPMVNWHKSWYVVSDYTYRLKTYFYAYDGLSSECVFRTSPSQYF